jgi:hypothetical protein
LTDVDNLAHLSWFGFVNGAGDFPHTHFLYSIQGCVTRPDDRKGTLFGRKPFEPSSLNLFLVFLHAMNPFQVGLSKKAE